MTTVTSGNSALIRRVFAIPSSPGMSMSMSTMSGCTSATFRIVDGEHDHGDIGKLGFDPPSIRDPVFARHVDVHEHDVWMHLSHFSHCGVRVAGLADDEKVFLIGKQAGEPLAE